ncbi:hypothetical protein QVD17_01782 [Tagetes erecta]|uniref:C2 domain-containing protein n=1 Tax=Tagetes erecta TaxID=13708 RepID=A0AAD8P8G1_TARER|nr:hypothetical protein QVD17_01782 [Tagetes erecta]
MDVYAVVSISGTVGKPQNLKTRIDKNGDTDPRWNFPMKFIIDEDAALQNQLTLVIKIKAAKMLFGDKCLGEVHVPVKELIDGVKTQNKKMMMKIVKYQVIRSSGQPKGLLTLSYEVGEKFSGEPAAAVETVTAVQGRRSRVSSFGGLVVADDGDGGL